MNFEIEEYVAKQKKKLSELPRKFDLCWAMDLVTKKPVMFEVLNVDLQYGSERSLSLPTIQPGMFVKISVDWGSSDYMNESFWIEVTNVNVDGNAKVHFFGTCANDTECVSYGSAIGPFYLRNIVQVGD
jgi:hypothetical protein